MAKSRLDRLVGTQGWLEKPADLLQKLVGGFYRVLGGPGRTLKSFANGTLILGHPAHPAISDVPVGAWLTGVILELVHLAGGGVPESAGVIAIIIGIIGAAIAVLTGLTDYADTYGHERRTATLHGLGMVLALVLFIVANVLGAGGHERSGFAFAVAGLVVVGLSAYVGGHVVFGIGTAVNRNAWLAEPGDYVEVGKSGDFAEGTMKKVSAGGADVLLTRVEGRLCAISNVCGHAGGPLDEGSLDGRIVTCPWHGSRFDVCTGKAKTGPATFAQPEFDVREENGAVAVKLKDAAH